MNVKEEYICRLCLKFAEDDIELIDETTRKTFEVLLLKVNLDISENPIICKDCAEVVAKCLHFKSVCLDTEKHLFTIDKESATFEFKYRKDIETVVDNLICRFCSNHLSGSNFVLLETITNDVKFSQMLQVLVPEMDFNITKNTLICTSCKQNLECYIKFVENCLDVEEKITKYFQNEGTPSSVQVKLSEIVQYSFKNMKLEYTQTCGIKEEGDILEEHIGEAHSEVSDGQFIKAEEPLNIKDEYINFNETACETLSETRMGNAYETKYKDEVNKKENQMLSSKNILEEKFFICEVCTHRSKRKDHFNIHVLMHKNITDEEMYKCSMCTYQTNRKDSMKRHILIHKDITEVETYKCSVCPYEAKYKNYLTRHMSSHKNRDVMYKCSLCSYVTKQKGNLKTHMSVHKKNKKVEMYKCSVCTFETKLKSDLKIHAVAHKNSALEIYKCPMCTFQAKLKVNLKIHMLIHKDVNGS